MACRAALRPRVPKRATTPQQFVTSADRGPPTVAGLRHRAIYLRPVITRPLPCQEGTSDLLLAVSATLAATADRLCPATVDQPALRLRMRQPPIRLARIMRTFRPDRQEIRAMCLVLPAVWDRLAS